MIDWAYKSIYCDHFDPDSLIILPMFSLLDDKEIQSLLVVDKITRKSKYSFTVIGKYQFSEVLKNIDPKSITEDVTQLFDFFNYFTDKMPTATLRGGPGEGCGPSGWQLFWSGFRRFVTRITNGGGGGSGGGGGGGNTSIGPHISPGTITFWHNIPPPSGGNDTPGNGGGGNDPVLCGNASNSFTFEDLELVMDNLTQYYDELGISSINGTPILEMLQPGCIGLDYTGFRSCLNASILCSINENYDLSDDEAICIRNSPQRSLGIDAILNGNNPNKNYIVNFYLRLICEYGIDISLDFILDVLESSDQNFEDQEEFDEIAGEIILETLLEECIGPFYVMLPALGTESLGEMLSFCTDPIPPIKLDPPNCEGCSVGESHIIAEDEYRALQMLDCAIEKLNQFDGIGPEEVKDALYNNFGATSSTAVASYISFLFEHIRRYPYPRKFQIQNNGEGNCGTNTLAWSFPVLHFTDVRLCSPSYFNATEITRSGTLIHEWMHLYYFAGDIAYIWQDEFNDLNSIQQLFNADAFEELVKELCDE